MLERVEVLKGPASVLYGGANPGGIVNMVRKRPTDEPYYYTEAGINSNGNAFAGFDMSDAIGDSGVYSYRLTGKLSGGDNYSDFSEDFRGFIMPQLTIAPTDTTSLTVWASYNGLDQVHTGNGFFPYVGTVVDAPFGKIDRDFFPGEPDLDVGRYSQAMIGYNFDHEFEGGWKISSNFRYGHLNKYEFGPYPFLYVETGDPTDPEYYDLNRINFRGDTSADNLALDNRIENTFDLGGAEHTVMAGIDYRYYRIENIQDSIFGGSSIDPRDPIYGLPQPAPNPLYNEVLAMHQVGVHAQDQIRFGEGWLVTLNGRYDYVHSDFDDRLPPGPFNPDDTYTSSDNAFSGRIGLAYEFDNGLTPYISAATFFNPLVGVGGSGPLAPEEGEQYEAGIKYEPTFIDGSLTASVFHINKENYTVSLPAFPFTRSQLGEVESRGFELEAKANINENWKLLGSLAYTDVETTKNPSNPAWEGKTPYIVPDWTASLWLNYTVTAGPLQGLSLGGGVRYKGESWADEINTLKVPSSTVVDASIRYKRNDWTASLNITNLFDKEYVDSCGGVGACGWGDARTVTFKLSKTW
jgi:iron complex outermembrane receptor protein